MTTWEVVPLPDELLPKPKPDPYRCPSTGRLCAVDCGTGPLPSCWEPSPSFRPTTLLPEPIQGEMFP